MQTSIDELLKRLAEGGSLSRAGAHAALRDLFDLDRPHDAQRLAHELGQLAKLGPLAERRLDLCGTSINDLGLAHLRSFENLHHLLLAETAITDAGMPHLAHFSQLRRLSLRGTDISDAGLVHLTKLRCLTALDLADTRASDKSLNTLRHAATLAEIDVTGTRYSSAGLRALERLLPKTKVKHRPG